MATLDLTKTTTPTTNYFTSNFLPTLSATTPTQTPTTITSQNITATQPISVTPKADTTNYAGMLAAAQQQALSIQQQISQLNQPVEQPKQDTSIQDYINSITSVQQPNYQQSYQDAYSQSGLDQKQADVNAKSQIQRDAEARLGNISAQLQAIATESQVGDLKLEQDAIGRGITSDVLARKTAEQRRQYAIAALPLQAQAYVAQAEVENARGNTRAAEDLFKQASDRFDKLFTLQMQDAQNRYEFKTNLINKVYDLADKKEQRQLDALKTQQAQDYQTQRENIEYQRQQERDKLLYQQDINKINLQNSTKATETTKLTATQKDDIATMDTVVSLANSVKTLGESINWSGVGGLGTGSVSQFLAKNFGTGSAEEQALRSNISNIQGTIAKLRGGTSFTENEQALLEGYVPTINDSPLVIKSKIEQLVNFINTKKANLLGTSSITTEAPKLNDVNSIDAWLNSF